MKYNPALDGVRAISVIAVLAFHTADPFFKGGFVGVDVFFVLSGFLITTLLRNELRASGQISLKRFYFRRAVRLIPPLVLSMAGVYLAYAVLLPDVDIGADVIAGLLYVSDYGKAFWNVPRYLGHSWSLSVEEHFYLIWPLFLMATRSLSDRALLLMMMAIFAAVFAWKIVDALLWGDFIRTYYRFDTRLGGLVLGSALAVHPIRVTAETAQMLGKYALMALAILVLVLPWHAMQSLLVGGFMTELVAVALIVSLTSGHDTKVAKALSHPWLVYIGVLSYSIYLWHYGLAIALRDRLDPVSCFSITFVASVAAAALSHRFVEAPLRRWINRTRAQSPVPEYAYQPG